MQDSPEEINTRSTPVGRIWLTLLAVTLVIGGCLSWMTIAYDRMLQKEVQQDTSTTLNTYSSALKLALDRRLLLTDGLKAYVNTALLDSHTLTNDHFHTFAVNFVGNLNGVRNLSVFPNGIAQFVYPLQSNQAILGMDLFKNPNPEVRENAERTRKLHSLTVLGPIHLKQGGLGLISRQSVFEHDQFWGFVSVVLDVPPILEEAGLENESLIQLALRADDKVIFGSESLFAHSPRMMTIKVGDKSWELAAMPSQAKLDDNNLRLKITMLSCLLILVLLNYLVYLQLTKRYKLQQMVIERTFHLTQSNQQLEATYEELLATEDELRLQNSLLENSERKLRQVAYRDTVTGLYNRVYFQERLEEMIAQARSRNHSFALLFLDLDQFKLINDTLGHANGDLLLQEVGSRLSGLLNHDELYSRIGGDEFTIILPSVEDHDQVHKSAQQVIQLFQEPFILQELEYYVTASVGVTLFPEHSQDAADLMKHADAAMYRAKEEGKNNYRFYDETLNADTNDKIYIKNSLRRALENNEFDLHYQPQIEISSRRIVGLEALIRWNHPKRGNIPPSIFIPIAEDCGLMESIGEWVLRKVCHQNKAWQDGGLPPLRTAVNLSARQFSPRNRLTEQIKGILAESGLDPAYLELEITENTAMRDDNAVTLQELRNLGITISIDDFGMQYSSLNYLKRLPVDKIKIDRSFVNGIQHDPKDEAIILAMLLMASHLNLSIVAEGVETQEQLAFLQSNQCNDIQGYLYYRPMPTESIERILLDHIPDAS